MARVNDKGYVERATCAGKNPRAKATYRDWWLIKYGGGVFARGIIPITSISLPAKYIGKRIKLKVEVLDD